MHQIEGEAEANGHLDKHAGARCMYTLEQHLSDVVQAARTKMASDCYTL